MMKINAVPMSSTQAHHLTNLASNSAVCCTAQIVGVMRGAVSALMCRPVIIRSDKPL